MQPIDWGAVSTIISACGSLALVYFVARQEPYQKRQAIAEATVATDQSTEIRFLRIERDFERERGLRREAEASAKEREEELLKQIEELEEKVEAQEKRIKDQEKRIKDLEAENAKLCECNDELKAEITRLTKSAEGEKPEGDK